MDQSILKSTKKILGLGPEYTPFDQDVATHINAAFSVLNQIGVGPIGGYFIDTEGTETWADFPDVREDQIALIKTYVFLKVRLLFDPPSTSYLIDAAEKQLGEYEWRLNHSREYAEGA